MRATVTSHLRPVWLTLSVLLCACGAKGPPKPPLSKGPEPVQGLFVRQSGPSIEVRWSRPAHRTDGAPIEGPLVYEVLARAEDRTQTRLADGGGRAAAARAAAESFFKSASVVARLAEPGVGSSGRVEGPVEKTSGRGPFRVLLGPERFPGSRPTSVRLAVTVVARDVRGRRSRPGTLAEIDPVAPLPALESFTAAGTREGVRLSWRLPAITDPVGVNIYRRLADGDPERGFPTKPVPGSPFTGSTGLDASSRLGDIYVYEGRVVSTAPGRGVRESLPATAPFEFTDRFPPGPPSLLTAEIVPATGAQPSHVIRLRWSSPIDADVSGYRIYRAEGDLAAVLRGQVSSGQTAWEDTQVTPGLQYHYSVTAIDGAAPPNESERSESVEAQ